MKFLGVILFCILSFGVVAQQKEIDRNAQVQKLSEVQAEIARLDEKIGHIEGRLSGMDPQSVPPTTQDELNMLKDKRNNLKRVEYSIQAYLESTEESENE